jgi:hypothetical protein
VAIRRPTIQERVELAERDLKDHAKTLSSHNEFLKILELRVNAIEEARRARQLEEVRREEREEAREKALNIRLDSLEKKVGDVQTDVKGIRGAGVKLAWIVITLVAGIVIAFAFKGGFTL